MKRTAKLALGVAAVLVVLGLFLLPVVPITIELYCPLQLEGCIPHESASASMMYAYFGVGAVRVPNMNNPLLIGQPSYLYCLMYGNPGTMCGQQMQRMNQMMTP